MTRDSELNMTNTKGYCKAVDLWSLGCVMAVILVGYAPFDDPYNDLKPEMESLEEDLRGLKISMRARGFLSSLLVPDEPLRMDTKEALSHPWLASPSQERRLEAIHQHMLLDWNPRSSNDVVIVDIDDLNGDGACVDSITSTPEPEPIGRPSVRRLQSIDHASETSYDEPAVKHNAQLRSPVSLSSPNNPNNSKSVAQPLTAPHTKPRVAASYATHAIVISSDQVASLKKIPTAHPDPSADPTLAKSFQPKRDTCPQVNIGPDGLSPWSFSRSFETLTRESPKPQPKLSKKGLHGICHGEFEEEEQVYEEVCNPVTGKRKRLIYGQDEGRVKKLLS